jgi:hypothetical protein
MALTKCSHNLDFEKKKNPNKKGVKHEKDEAQEAVIDSFGKFFCDKKIWNYLFLTCKLD